jgi:N6-adenosine-specific RNA methylase IME4
VKYRTIVADPPWPFQWGGGKGGRRRRETALGYPTMRIAEIAALPIGDLAEPDAHLYLWATDEIYREGQAVDVARAWGFEPCGPSLIWAKRNLGMGYFPRPAHEIILVCRRGHLAYALNNVPSVQWWSQVRGRGNTGKQHSRKPEGLQDLVERASPGPYLELFARRQRLGWDTWGNEALEHVRVAP